MARSKYVVPVLLAGGLAGVFGAFSQDAARAYKFYMNQDGTQPLRWWQRDTLQFSLAQVPPEETSLESVRGFAETAIGAWVDAPCGLVPEVTFGTTSTATHATTPTSLRSKPDNLIVFISSSSQWAALNNSPTWIAITKIAHDPKTGEIVDADIEINDGGYTFSYDDSPISAEVDFLSMLTHEEGHFFGLDHSTDPTSTMYATYATSPESAMDARTLAQDDIDGICALYTDVPVHKDPSSGSGDCSASGSAGLWGLALFMLVLRRRRAA